MFDLSRLRALHAVSAHGSITAAAAALGYTPSAVSQQIAKLEREARTPLLDRQGSRVRLTPAAWLLAESAEKILTVLEQTQTRLEEQRDEPGGTLVLAAFPTACRGFVARAIADLTAAHPAVDCRLVEADPRTAVAQAARGDVDVAVVHDWHNTPLTRPENLSATDFGEDVADVLVPCANPLSGRSHVTPEDLRDERWVSQSPGTLCHEWLVRCFAEAGLEPDICYRIEEFETQIALLSAGVGVAMQPRLGRGPLPPQVRAVPLFPQPTRRISACWRTQAADRPALHALLTALHAAWPDETPDPPRPDPH
jgi:DNA-binding transcriptional LysR family regulator